MRKLVKEGIILSIINCADQNHDDEDVLQLAAAVLSNLASDSQASERMIEEGCIETLLTISTSFPGLYYVADGVRLWARVSVVTH